MGHRREWQLTLVLLPGKSRGQVWQAIVHGVTKSDTTKQLTHTQSELLGKLCRRMSWPRWVEDTDCSHGEKTEQDRPEQRLRRNGDQGLII